MHTLLAAADSTTTTSVDAGPLVVAGLVGYVIYALALMGIFTKSGEAGWQGFVPIWNTLVLLKISGRPMWWFILMLIPVVNIVILIIVYYSLSLSFGHGAGFTIGLIFLSIIFLYVLWLGPSRYVGPGGSATPQSGGTVAV